MGGWAIDPLGFRITLNDLYDRYQKPLFVVENNRAGARTSSRRTSSSTTITASTTCASTSRPCATR